MDMRRKLEAIVDKLGPVEDTKNTILPEKVITQVQARLEIAGFHVEKEITVPPTQFRVDLLIRHGGFCVPVEIETGRGARIELDLLKLMAFAKRIEKPSEFQIYGWLLVSDKYLSRTTTGTPKETGFNYVKRVLRLADLPASGLRDLLVVEFQTLTTQG